MILERPLKFAHAAGEPIKAMRDNNNDGNNNDGDNDDDGDDDNDDDDDNDGDDNDGDNNDGNDNNFDFGDGGEIEKPKDHLKNLEKVINEEVAKQHGDTNLKEAVSPLVKKAETLQESVKKG